MEKFLQMKFALNLKLTHKFILKKFNVALENKNESSKVN